MKRLALAWSLCILAGCATPPADRGGQAQYGTPPSDTDIYQYLSEMRDDLPPTRYVSYRDKGYNASLKQITVTDDDGQTIAGWEYDFEASNYDTVDGRPIRWTGYRTFFFNGRPIGLIDPQGRLRRFPATAPDASAEHQPAGGTQ